MPQSAMTASKDPPFEGLSPSCLILVTGAIAPEPDEILDHHLRLWSLSDDCPGRSGLAAAPFLRGPGILAAFVARQLEIFSAIPNSMDSHEILKTVPAPYSLAITINSCFTSLISSSVTLPEVKNLILPLLSMMTMLLTSAFIL
jgi:hypothetical protein